MSHHRHHEEKSPSASLPLSLPLLSTGDLEVLQKILPELSTAGQRLINMLIKAFEKTAASLDINRLAENLPEGSISPELLMAAAPLLSGLNLNTGSIKDLLALLGNGQV